MDELKKIKIEINKLKTQFISNAEIHDCFYHRKEECKGKIKSAHSIQRNGRLSLLEEYVGENKMLYSFLNIDFNITTQEIFLKPIGKAKASTFFGFCDYHDTILFGEIENKPFEDSDIHYFLHSYRAFAHTHHKKTEQIRAFSENSDYLNMITSRREELLNGTLVGFEEGERNRNRFNEIIEIRHTMN